MVAFAYLRKSSVHKLDRTLSWDVQESRVKAMARRYGDAKGLVLLSDWDKSGTLGRDKRPGYDALLTAIETGGCSALYSYSMSRLARSVSELSALFALCQSKGVPIRLEADVIDTSTASGMLNANVLASVAQFEAQVTSERMRAALEAKRDRGERIGSTPFYGDKPGENPARILAAFREAGSYGGAARLLNQRGVKPRSSRRGWWPSSVRQIVRRLDPSVLPLRPSKGVPAGGADLILARLLRCPTCGTLLTGTRDRGGRRVRYSCRLGGVVPHPRVGISENLILPKIIAEVGHLRTPEAVEVEEGDVAKRVQLEGRRLRIIDLFESGIIDRSDRDRRLAAVLDGLGRLDARRVALAVPPVSMISWSEPPRVLNGFLQAVFQRIDLDPETFQPVGYVWTVPAWRR
jgi:DNA invertase Pin-like site-specific DNA recombinase